MILKDKKYIFNLFLRHGRAPKGLLEDEILIIDTVYQNRVNIPLNIIKFYVNFKNSVLGY